MQTINWTTNTGTALEVIISTDFLVDRQGRRKTAGEMQVVISATVNGKSHNCVMGIQTITGHATCVARLGDIGLTAERLTPIAAAIETAKAEIAAHNDALAAHTAKLDSLGNGNINTMFGADA